MSSSDICNAAGRSEIVSFCHRIVAALTESNHRLLKERSLLRMRPEPLKPRSAKDLLKRWLSSSNRMKKLREGLKWFAVYHAHEIAWARRKIGSESCTEFRLRETSRRYFAKHAFAGYQTHDAIKRIGICSSGLRQLVSGALSRCEEISDA